MLEVKIFSKMEGLFVCICVANLVTAIARATRLLIGPMAKLFLDAG